MPPLTPHRCRQADDDGPLTKLVQFVQPAVGDDAFDFVRIGDVRERIAVGHHEVGERRLDRAAVEAERPVRG